MPASGRNWLLAAELSNDNIVSIVVGCLILMGLVVVAAVSVMWLRKWVKSGEDLPVGGFSLSDLRELQRTGKISREEFEQTRAMILAAAKKSSEKAENAPTPPRK